MVVCECVFLIVDVQKRSTRARRRVTFFFSSFFFLSRSVRTTERHPILPSKTTKIHNDENALEYHRSLTPETPKL
jgi:hypothetical protein